jgi:HSP20 family protein
MGVRYRRIDYRYTVSNRGSFPAHLHTAPAFWRPAADLIESAGAVEVTVEVPGVDEDDLEITLFQNALVVEGVRQPPSRPSDCRFYAAEIRYGPFRLEVDIPGAIDAENITATYSAGMLHLRVPRSLRGAGR